MMLKLALNETLGDLLSFFEGDRLGEQDKHPQRQQEHTEGK